MPETSSSYGLWPLVIVSSLVTIIFAFSFTRPKTVRDWRSLGVFLAFMVALFTEMYGFPLTIYFLSGWLTATFPGMDIFSHNSGHLLENLFGWGGDPHFGPFHIVSYVFIGYGFVLVARAWEVLYAAQKSHTLAISGPYARIRHPQYAGFVLIMFGFLLQWPTLLTLIMFPILVWIYVRLAKSEEADAEKEFGDAWRVYVKETPAFIPKWNQPKVTLSH